MLWLYMTIHRLCSSDTFQLHILCAERGVSVRAGEQHACWLAVLVPHRLPPV